MFQFSCRFAFYQLFVFFKLDAENNANLLKQNMRQIPTFGGIFGLHKIAFVRASGPAGAI